MKLSKNSINSNTAVDLYDYYIGLDWSISNAGLARMRSNGDKIHKQDLSPDIKVIKEYLKELKGKKILTIEETTGSHWLYVELRDIVDKIVICNPSRNHLLKEGAKTDKIDAVKLCQLLRSGLLKEVYHTDDEKNYDIRKLVSTYEDLVRALARIKNQYSALYRSIGLNSKKNKNAKLNETTSFISEHQLNIIEYLSTKKKEFEELFRKISREHEVIRKIDRISGFAHIHSVQAYGTIIDATRFLNKYHFWSYCGLVKMKRESGKSNYYRKNLKYSRRLKYVVKSATRAALAGRNDIREYYEHLLRQGFTQKNARNTITRYIAKSLYAVMKKNVNYKPYSWRIKPEDKAA